MCYTQRFSIFNFFKCLQTITFIILVLIVEAQPSSLLKVRCSQYLLFPGQKHLSCMEEETQFLSFSIQTALFPPVALSFLQRQLTVSYSSMRAFSAPRSQQLSTLSLLSIQLRTPLFRKSLDLIPSFHPCAFGNIKAVFSLGLFYRDIRIPRSD